MPKPNNNNILKNIFIKLIKFYQYFSKYTPRVCRFYPTCSEYTKQAIIQHGVIKGCFLGFKRIIKCHPFHPGGYDPCPKANKENEDYHKKK